MVRVRALKIVRFLQEFTRLKIVVKRDVEQYEDLLWFSDVPDELACYTKGRPADDDLPADLWLQVKKQPEPRVPLPPDGLQVWASLESLGDSSKEPQPRPEIVLDREPPPGDSEPLPPELLKLQDHPEIVEQWSVYVAHRWKPWASLHQRWRRVHEVYSKLFSIHQELVKLGEELELVVGVGLLSWKTPKQQVIRRHLMTARATLRFDASIGVFSVGAPIHVQGPPGTGKSHTIANLICHLLASGKRVLVTAQTPRALKVLHEKIPKDIQPLCVSLLGNDKASFDHLERCVREIVSRFESFRESVYQTRIHESETLLIDLRRREAEVKGQLKALRERETLEHAIADGRYKGTAAAIANRVAAETESLGWLTDPIEPLQPPPLNDAEAADLLRLLSSSRSPAAAPSRSYTRSWR